MKPTLVFFLLLVVHLSFAQSLDYISVRKKNGRVLKNFFSGSDILLQTTDGTYWQGPVRTLQNDTLYLTVYDVRYMPTVYGGFVRDTLTTSVVPVYYKNIKRIQLNPHENFFQRTGPVLLMLAGGGYLTLNILNGAFYNQSVPGRERVRKIAAGASLFGLGYLLQKLFHSDGFSKPSHQILYTNLSPKKA